MYIPVFILLLLSLTASCADETGSSVVNPCCYYPCQNSGVCVRYGTDRYECDCTRTGYYGENCSIPEFGIWVREVLKPSEDTIQYILTHFHWFWDLVNNSFLRDMIMRVVLTSRTHHIPSPPTYNSKYGYLNWEAYNNISYYTRILPPVPEDCPLPMGTKGKPVLPDAKLVAERLFLRRKFKPDPQGTSMMFSFYAQHFVHQFFKTDFKMGPGFTMAESHGVDGASVYGDNLERQLHLRLLKDGKMKYQIINGEMYPPTVEMAPVKMIYPKDFPAKLSMALGEVVYGMLPGLTMYSTLWMREHNRVCDILKAEHPTWDDEQLYQTTKLITIGQIIRIVIEEYVQQLSGYLLKLKFDPSLLFNKQFQYSNRIALEFNHLYHWHSLMPDSFIIDGTVIPYSQFLYNTSIVTHYGVEKLVDAFSHQVAGQIGGGKNIPAQVIKVPEQVILHSRELRVQPFNEYRKKFNIKPYASFDEFTDDKEMARELEELYGHIDALEFYPGLILEGTKPNRIFGESMLVMGAPFSLKGLMGNPICSPEYWKPSTFGGQTGFDIVNSATLEKLVCQNTKWCPYVAFHVPRNEEEEAKPRKPPTEL